MAQQRRWGAQDGVGSVRLTPDEWEAIPLVRPFHLQREPGTRERYWRRLVSYGKADDSQVNVKPWLMIYEGPDSPVLDAEWVYYQVEIIP